MYVCMYVCMYVYIYILLENILEKLNSKNKTIKFEHKISHSNIAFLDTLIYKDKNNTLQATLYQKPTDQQSYLYAHPDHPKSLKGVL